MSQVVEEISEKVVSSSAGIRRQGTIENARHLAAQVAKVCVDFRGQDTVVLDTTKITPLFDFFVITTGNSRRQNHAIANTADDVLAQLGSTRLGTEGMETGWICHDYGDIVLHVFTPDARELYKLEHLWADAPRVDWEQSLQK